MQLARQLLEDNLRIDLPSIGMRIFNEEPGDKMSWDELRIGETWEDVISPLGDQDVMVVVDPEPTCVVPADGVPADLDGDGTVNVRDFLRLSRSFGQMDVAYEEGDINCDGNVNVQDFLALSRNFGGHRERKYGGCARTGLAFLDRIRTGDCRSSTAASISLTDTAKLLKCFAAIHSRRRKVQSCRCTFLPTRDSSRRDGKEGSHEVTSFPIGLYACRTARRDRDHRHADHTSASGGAVRA